MKKKVLTLCIARQPEQILLGMKKRGFGSGRWNGFGGKVEPNETIEEAARREMIEECCASPQTLTKKAILSFEFTDSKEFLEVHVFEVVGLQGEIKETEEMKPEWFGLNNIPYDSMWPDDRYWLPQFLAGKKIKGYFRFKDEANMLDYKVEEVFDFYE